MNTPRHNSREGAPPGASIEPAPEATAQSQADELLAHGLLTYLHNDHPSAQNARVTRVMSAIAAEPLPTADDAPAPFRFRMPIRSVRGWVALAASIGLVALAGFFGFPGETSAQAVVKQSIEAMRAGVGGGDRRYEVRLTVRAEDGPERTLDPAIVDMRSPDQLLLRVRSPEGDDIVAGRDGIGDWCIRLPRDGGGIEREHPQMAWPRWSRVGEESLFADSVDRLLEEMTRGYTLSRRPDGVLEGSTKPFHHIIATKKRLRSPGGDTVEIWIDPDTNAVERMVMKWNDQPDDRPMRPRAPRAGPEGGPDADGAPARRHRPRPFPPEHDAPGPDDGPRGERPDHPPGGPDGPVGIPGLGPVPPGAFGPRPQGPQSQGLEGPGRAPGDRRGPPKMIVIQRVDAPVFPANWFSPETHNQ